jgi:hypothetical protein
MCTTFKCKVKQAYKVPKERGPSIIEEDMWQQMRSFTISGIWSMEEVVFQSHEM